jgi:hypothetical protein
VTERTEIEPSAGHGFELPEFDERAARRAIRRGIFRTAFAALLLAFVALICLEIVSHFWQTRGDREERFQAVAGLGFLVANPGWEGEASGCCNSDLTSIELALDIWPQGASPTGERTRAWLRLNLLGRVVIDSIPVLPETAVDEALSRGGPDKEATRALLAELPDPVSAMAIVDLAEPMSALEFAALLRAHDVPSGEPELHNSPPVFLEDPYPPVNDDAAVADHGYVVKLAWPNPWIAATASGTDDRGVALADPLTQFTTWARMLRERDNGNLERLDLPPAGYIKRLAENPQVHGFLLKRATIDRLQGFLDDPRIRSVNVADVAFDLSQSQPESPELLP